jgi:hypothetical protein
LTVTPAQGSATQSITLTAAAPCPRPATNVIARVEGAGFPKGGQIVVGNSSLTTYPKAAGGGLSIPLTYTMRDYAMTAGFTALRGTYTFTVTCLKSPFARTGVQDFTGSLRFTSPGAYRDGSAVPGVNAPPVQAPQSDPNADPAPGATATATAPGAAGTSGANGGKSTNGAEGANGGAGTGATPGGGSGGGPGTVTPPDGTHVSAASTVREHSNAPLVFWSVTGFSVAFLVIAVSGFRRLRDRRRHAPRAAGE